MKTTLFPAHSRGRGDYGWLKTRYSFSFAEYYDPARMGFGALRVLNDDRIAGGAGFPDHSHRDMEIATIVLEGTLAHRDSTGAHGLVKPGEIQVMSAGTGVTHSEFNASPSEPLELLQLWVITARPGAAPRYGQAAFPREERLGTFQEIIAPRGTLSLHQRAWFSLLELESNGESRYETHAADSGVFFFVIEGQAEIGGELLKKRDAVGVEDARQIPVRARVPLFLLAVEVPMEEE